MVWPSRKHRCGSKAAAPTPAPALDTHQHGLWCTTSLIACPCCVFFSFLKIHVASPRTEPIRVVPMETSTETANTAQFRPKQALIRPKQMPKWAAITSPASILLLHVAKREREREEEEIRTIHVHLLVKVTIYDKESKGESCVLWIDF